MTYDDKLLSEKLLDTIELIEVYEQTKIKVDKYDKYKSYLDYLNEVKNDVFRYYKMVMLLSDYDINENINFDFNKEIEFLNEGLSKIDSWELPERDILYKLESKISEQEEVLKEEWQNYIENVSSDLLNTLDIIEQLLNDNQNIKNIISDIDKMKNNWPLKERDLQDFESTLEEARELISDLNVQSDIQRFLLKVSSGQATVDDLTDEILNWIRSNNFEENLKIKFY